MVVGTILCASNVHQAAVVALRNTRGLPCPREYNKKNEEDIPDWLQAMFGFQIFPLNEKIESINDQYWTLPAEELRNVIDLKRHYKKGGLNTFPKYFQFGRLWSWYQNISGVDLQRRK